MPVEMCRIAVLDIHGEHKHGEIAGRRAQRRDERQVAREVSAAARFGEPASLHRIELGIALHERKAQEDEHREREQPEREVTADGGGSGDDASGIEHRQHDDIHHHLALEVHRVTKRECVVAQQHGRKAPWKE
ncbi:hypothetical protein NECAME_16085 [Necator americanus]|uniref:Uncharacterized protein n=1 Tax=Necator americanus TaxID=51031 RepID=W2U0M6_NECAM|nr:hypothetical protein NECAME_16085 [Necator americanus]ETN86852.1 hypothetical protein NECAME_16085 [Necator americanus]